MPWRGWLVLVGTLASIAMLAGCGAKTCLNPQPEPPGSCGDRASTTPGATGSGGAAGTSPPGAGGSTAIGGGAGPGSSGGAGAGVETGGSGGAAGGTTADAGTMAPLEDASADASADASGGTDGSALGDSSGSAIDANDSDARTDDSEGGRDSKIDTGDAGAEGVNVNEDGSAHDTGRDGA